jgi:uncharacterized protein YndB with AHSA1/START domain
MGIIKKIVLGLAILLLLVSAIGLLFFSSHVEIRRSVTINRPVDEVFDYLNNLSNYNQWSPWYQMDTAAQYTFTGPVSGLGAKMSWVSKNEQVGQGSLVYTEVVEDKSIKHDLNFMENGVAKGEYVLEPTDEGTKVSWVFSFEAGANPLLRIMGSLMQDMVAADFDKGLARMKGILESPSFIPESEEIEGC